MPEISPDYVQAITKALLTSRVLPSAIEDLTNRLLRDRPHDITGYLETCQSALPSYFAPKAPAPPAVPAPGDPDYSEYFLGNLAVIAGAPPSTPPSGAPPLPRSIPAGNDKLFLDNLARVADGSCVVTAPTTP